MSLYKTSETQADADPASALVPYLKSTSGRFIVVGPNVAQDQYWSKWLEDTSADIERVTGLDLTFKQHSFRLYLSEQTPSKIESWKNISRRELSQKTVIYNISAIDNDLAKSRIVPLLMQDYFWQQKKVGQIDSPENGENKPVVHGDQKDIIIPEWLSEGIIQNFDPKDRTRNRQAMLAKWQIGEMATLKEFFLNNDKHPDKAMSGIVVDWFASMQDKPEFFRQIFEILSRGDKLSTESLIAMLDGVNDIADLGKKWDLWMLRQKRTVGELGVLSLQDIEQLRAELLLYPGTSGIPLSSGIQRGLRLRDVIKSRNENWIKDYASSKYVELKLLSAGKSEEFRKVISLYCYFFDALGRRKKESYLKKRLAEAEKSLAELNKSLSVNTK